RQKQLSAAWRRARFEPARDEIVGQRRDTDHQRQPMVPAGIEVETRDKEDADTHPLPRKQPIGNEDDEEEVEEWFGAEKHVHSSDATARSLVPKLLFGNVCVGTLFRSDIEVKRSFKECVPNRTLGTRNKDALAGFTPRS